jgi:hypothetical protein
MKDTALHPVAADYRVEVARVLADLPPGEAEEILDDVELNLTEVIAEFDDAVTSDLLRARLGTPAEYAAELRAAAGYPPQRVGGSLGGARFKVAELVLTGLVAATAAAFLAGFGIGWGQGWWIAPCLVALVAVEAGNALWLRGREPGVPEIAALSITRRARALGASLRTGRSGETVRFVTGLRSAWWVARAAVVGLTVAVLNDQAWWGVAAGVAMLVGSLWLGARSIRDRRLLWAAIPVNLLVLGLGVGVVASGELKSQDRYVYSGENPYGPVSYYPGPNGQGSDEAGLLLSTLNGRPVENIYPFDSQGRPLKDVLLFDQDGKQLGLVRGDLDRGCDASGGYPPQPLVGDRARLPFPQPRVTRNPNTGECRVETGVPFTIAIPVQPGQATPAPQSSGGGQQQSSSAPESSGKESSGKDSSGTGQQQNLPAPQPTAPPSGQAGQPTSPTGAPASPLGAAPLPQGDGGAGRVAPNGRPTEAAPGGASGS